MKVTNITVLEYFLLEDKSEYDVFVDVVKPENKLCGKIFDVKSMTFNEFKTIILILNNPTIQLIKDLFVLLYKIRGDINMSADKTFLNENVFQFFKAKRFLVEMVREKLILEDKMLYSEPDSRMIEIGGYKALRPYNTQLTKINLAKQFGTKPSEVGKWKYTEVLNILAANNVVANVQKEYNAK